jgi:Flp pilus assembly protein TadG
MKHLIRKLTSKAKDNRGQAGIEFMAVVIVIFFFLFFFLSLSIVFVVSDYVEYATFMAARTYKSMFSTEQVQEENARRVFNSYMQQIQGIARNYNLTFLPGDERGNQGAGVKATYTMDLFYLPPVFIVDGIPPSAITLTSESRLGRDPSNQECSRFFTKFVEGLGLGTDASNFAKQMDDNGC